MADSTFRPAVVTGAGRGLGRDIAIALAARGHTILGVSRDPARLSDTAAVVERNGGRMMVCPTDLGDKSEVSDMIRFAHDSIGEPGILVNAAGVFGPIALVRDADPDAWVETVRVDLVAPFLTIRGFLGGMVDSGWGRIVNVTSAASLHPPGALNSAYATAKVGLNQLTRHVAAEVAGTGVTANVIHPGDVKTDMWRSIAAEVSTLGPEAEPYRQWAAWVEETGGDPPSKAVELVLQLTSESGGSTNGEFCWVEDPLQPPIDSWDPAPENRPWDVE